MASTETVLSLPELVSEIDVSEQTYNSLFRISFNIAKFFFFSCSSLYSDRTFEEIYFLTFSFTHTGIDLAVISKFIITLNEKLCFFDRILRTKISNVYLKKNYSRMWYQHHDCHCIKLLSLPTRK
jgi:hypothetical protein